MIAYKIKITKVDKDTYWYRDMIDEVFWATLLTYPERGYSIIHEGVGNDRNRWVGEDDCEILKESEVELIITKKVVEII